MTTEELEIEISDLHEQLAQYHHANKCMREDMQVLAAIERYCKVHSGGLDRVIGYHDQHHRWLLRDDWKEAIIRADNDNS